jgi:hypothetical protein
MAKVRQEIVVFDGNTVLIATTGGTATGVPISSLNTGSYDGATYFFEVLATTGVSAATVTLRRKGTTTDDATCTIPGGSTSRVLIRSNSFSPPAGSTEYVIFLTAGATGVTNVFIARIIILQNVSPLTKTETQIVLGSFSYGGAISSTTLTSPGGARYWKYTSANWDGTLTVTWEVVLNSQSTKITATAELQVADGTGDGFVNWSAVGSDITSAAGVAERKRSSAITLTAGRNYRVVFSTSNSKSNILFYNARIIITQTNSPTKFEAQYFMVPGGFAGGTSLQSCLTSWDSTEWSSVANTYQAAFDGINGSTSVAELDTAGGVQIVGSSVSSPDNQGISGSLTMPVTGNLDCKMTTANDALNAARILVLVVIQTTNTDPPFLPNTQVPQHYIPSFVNQ